MPTQLLFTRFLNHMFAGQVDALLNALHVPVEFPRAPITNSFAMELLVFLVLVVQLSDVFQYVWGKLLGRHKIAPHLSPNKTVEGAFSGLLFAVAGSILGWAHAPAEPVHRRT